MSGSVVEVVFGFAERDEAWIFFNAARVEDLHVGFPARDRKGVFRVRLAIRAEGDREKAERIAVGIEGGKG